MFSNGTCSELYLLKPSPVSRACPGPSSPWLILLPIVPTIKSILVALLWWGWGWDITVGCGWGHATLPLLVEDQHSGAPLEAGVAALARPVPIARLAQGNFAIGVVFTKG